MSGSQCQSGCGGSVIKYILCILSADAEQTGLADFTVECIPVGSGVDKRLRGSNQGGSGFFVAFDGGRLGLRDFGIEVGTLFTAYKVVGAVVVGSVGSVPGGLPGSLGF